MEIRIQSIHFDATEQLQAFIQKKVSKLEKYYEDIKKVEVSLKVVKPETAENKEAGITVLVPNNDFHASKICDTLRKQSTCVWKHWKNSWLNTRKSNEINKNIANILRERNK